MIKRKAEILLLFLLTAWSSSYGQQIFSEQTLKFGRALALVEAFYVDSTDAEKLTEKAIVEMLQSLDPHSVYLTREETEESNETLNGNFEGIGIQFNILYDSIIVISPIPGGPSEAVGLRAGDRIVGISGESVAGIGITTNGVRKRLLGDKGTKVEISVFRRGEKNLLDFTITRDKIPVNSLDAAYMLDDNTGFIKLNRFAATSADEFDAAVASLKRSGMNNLVLDLRNNTGGYLDAAIKITDKFFDEKRLLVYLEGLHTSRQNYYSEKGGGLSDARIVVLVDEGSASASEILSGALQDWDRGVILGRRTFGKGLVQNGFGFPDGSMMRLTIARYFTPTGRLIQRPYNDGVDKYISDYLKRYTDGELMSADSIHFPDSLKYSTLINGRTVYGGGGIMPDVFLPVDTTGFSPYYSQLVRKNVITEFSLDYTDRHRNDLERKYRTFDQFKSDFAFSEKDKKDFIQRAAGLGVDFSQAQYDLSEELIFKILKGLVARDIWDMSEYYQVVYEDDPAIIKAKNIIADTQNYNRLLGVKSN